MQRNIRPQSSKSCLPLYLGHRSFPVYRDPSLVFAALKEKAATAGGIRLLSLIYPWFMYLNRSVVNSRKDVTVELLFVCMQLCGSPCCELDP